MPTSAEIRRAYLDFFVQKHAHTEVPSSPVVPHDDPTLLFTNAGMNQFKPIFLGQEKRAYTRAVDTQKCIRAGGKHNDLDDVGRSRRHHTFFEMLGNWSFGDYFKRGAISMSWELLTQVFKLDATRIHVTCYEGDPANGVPRDTEAANLWKEIAGLPDDHIHFLGKDNFWEMGDTGPCGPCTEIFYDRTPDKTGGPSIRTDSDPRVMEFWNNVFIQYNRNADRTLVELPAQHVDTGIGFERICQILQDVDSNYSIDLWHPFWEKLRELSGHTYSGKFTATNSVDAAAEAADEGLRKDIAFRVIGDHARCLTFALTDGATPSNEGRGYVLRRILRRAARFGRQSLGLREPFLFSMVQVVVDTMGDAFPELRKNPGRVVDLIRDEEGSFGRTLDRGIELFSNAATMAAVSQRIAVDKQYPDWIPPFVGAKDEAVDVSAYPNNAAKRKEALQSPAVISAEAAFKLHDTFGFPIDLTQIMAAERGMTVDLEGYETLMEEARAKARARGKTGGENMAALPPAALAQLEADGVPATDDSPKFTASSPPPLEGGGGGRGSSVGGVTRSGNPSPYPLPQGEGEPVVVAAIWNGSSLVESAKPDASLAILLDRTPFYAEMGGQIGDAGTLTAPGIAFVVETTKAVGKYVLHIGRLTAGVIKVGTPLTATVDALRRGPTQNNHTATHLLNWSLRQQLTGDIMQKGSLADPDKLRFDFSYGKPLTEAELDAVEAGVAKITKESPLTVYTAEVPQEQALKINGLRAVFGEKYPPLVRVVSVGVPVADLLADPTNEKWPGYSIEFCGGTHVAETKSIHSFAVVGEESVSKGVRRITAVTGEKAAAAWEGVDRVAALLAKADAAVDAEVPAAIMQINQALAAAVLPLSAKRRAQAKVVALQARVKAAEKAAKSQGGGTGVDAVAAAAALLEAAVDLGGGKIVIGEISGATDDQLRAAIDSLRRKSPSLGVMIGSAGDAKVSFISVVSDDLIAKGLKAGDWIRETAKIAGGGGGGRPQMAQAGGKDPAKLGAALERAREVARAVLGA